MFGTKRARHEGTETYRVVVEIDSEAVEEGFYDLPVPYSRDNKIFRPRYVQLVWSRRSVAGVASEWVLYRHDCTVSGPVVLASGHLSERVTKRVPMLTYARNSPPELHNDVKNIPGLLDLLAEIEKDLPA